MFLLTSVKTYSNIIFYVLQIITDIGHIIYMLKVICTSPEIDDKAFFLASFNFVLTLVTIFITYL